MLLSALQKYSLEAGLVLPILIGLLCLLFVDLFRRRKLQRVADFFDERKLKVKGISIHGHFRGREAAISRKQSGWEFKLGCKSNAEFQIYRNNIYAPLTGKKKRVAVQENGQTQRFVLLGWDHELIQNLLEKTETVHPVDALLCGKRMHSIRLDQANLKSMGTRLNKSAFEILESLDALAQTLEQAAPAKTSVNDSVLKAANSEI